MKLKRGPSRFWTAMFRAGFARAHLPFWRVVVEAKLDRAARNWPDKLDRAVAPVFVWARSIEEAEALASLAVEEEGLRPMTADAVKTFPAAAPSRGPLAVSRGELKFLKRLDDEVGAPPPSRRGAKA